MSETDAPAAPQTERKSPWPLIAAVTAITLILILLVPGEEDPADTPTPSTPNTGSDTPAPSLLTPENPPASTPAPMQTPETAAADSDAAPAPAVALPPGAAARELIATLRQQSPLDLDRAISEAASYQHQGRVEDAYLLYFFAAREGHAGAAMTLAQQADPAHFKPGGLFDRADELQANKWYQVAAQAGQAEANTALQALRARVEQAAAGGDERAHRIMLQWK